jgi:hypothetical protein
MDTKAAVPDPKPFTPQNRSILGGYFQKIRPTCNQRLAAPRGETFLGGTHKALELALPYPAEHTPAATAKRRPQR